VNYANIFKRTHSTLGIIYHFCRAGFGRVEWYHARNEVNGATAFTFLFVACSKWARAKVR